MLVRTIVFCSLWAALLSISSVVAAERFEPLAGMKFLRSGCLSPVEISEPEVQLCSKGRTKLVAEVSAEGIARRRVLFQITMRDSVFRDMPFVPLTISSFDEHGLVQHAGALVPIEGGKAQISAYIPPEARRAVLGVEFGDQRSESTAVDVRVFQTRDSYEPNSMCKQCSEYLQEALDRIAERFLFIERVDLKDLSRQARLNASGTADVAEVHSAVRDLTRRLNDRHTRFLSKSQIEQIRSQMNNIAESNTPSRAYIHDKVAVLKVTTFSGVDESTRNRYARHLNEEIQSLCARHPHGWIVDLRDHGGGSLKPALDGLAPLMATTPVGFSVNRRGQRVPWDGASDDTLGTCAGSAVAVLIGPSTASAGEAVAIALRGAGHARLFGARTGGYTTAVYDREMSDGSVLGVSNAYFSDIGGNVYQDGVQPDEELLLASGGGDGALIRARKWIAIQNADGIRK